MLRLACAEAYLREMLAEPFEAFTFFAGVSFGLPTWHFWYGSQGTQGLGAHSLDSIQGGKQGSKYPARALPIERQEGKPAMSSNPFYSGVSRRVLLSALAAIPALSGPLLSLPVRAQTDPLASWKDGPSKQAITGFVAARHPARRAGFRAARRAYRDVRQRRHAVGRTPDVYSIGLRDRTRQGSGAACIRSGRTSSRSRPCLKAT